MLEVANRRALLWPPPVRYIHHRREGGGETAAVYDPQLAARVESGVWWCVVVGLDSWRTGHQRF